MSKYTTELRFICEQLAGCAESQGYDKVAEIIEKARKKIFDFDYPLFDNAYKPVIETKILRHFYTREIGAETYGRWKLFLEDRLNIIMPYYNQLYKSELLEFNPLYDVDITTTRHGVIDNETSHDNVVTDEGSTTAENTEWNKFSDTPQGTVADLDNSTYLTDARNITDDGSTTNENTTQDSGTGTSNTVEDYLERVKGKRSGFTYSKVLLDYRDTFLNIDAMVIKELNDLFFNLW